MFVLVMLFVLFILFFFFKQKTAYEMRISDWSSDVCSSDLFGSALFLIDILRTRGIAFPPGTWVSAGAITGIHEIRPGQRAEAEIGRASCRERVCQYV